MMNKLFVIGILTLASCQQAKFETVKTEYHVIDSVWVVPPGHVSTVQLDPLYCYMKDGQIIKSRQRLKTGDTVWYKWLKRVEKDSGPN